ncbi:hypothetical protein EXIGLDRAFT_720002, partial [Exidia glandulosa HHB12029]
MAGSWVSFKLDSLGLHVLSAPCSSLSGGAAGLPALLWAFDGCIRRRILIGVPDLRRETSGLGPRHPDSPHRRSKSILLSQHMTGPNTAGSYRFRLPHHRPYPVHPSLRGTLNLAN